MNQIALYVSATPLFFSTLPSINCSVGEFCGSLNADKIAGVIEALESKLTDTEFGIRLSKPVRSGIETPPITEPIEISISHHGILAICSRVRENDSENVQLVNINNGKTVRFNPQQDSKIGFYDDFMIMLTDYKPLRECLVDDVFIKPTTDIMTEIEDTSEVRSNADVSLLNSTRVLYCTRIYSGTGFLSYNVDTKTTSFYDTAFEPDTFLSVTGINMGVRAVYTSATFEKTTYKIDNNMKGDQAPSGSFAKFLTSVIPSESEPEDFRKSVWTCGEGLSVGGNIVRLDGMIGTEFNHAPVRIYKDVFIIHDYKSNQLMFLRIIVP